MSDKPEKSLWAGKAALAGAAVGSAAIAAALLYASRRKDRADKSRTVLIPPPRKDMPEAKDMTESEVTKKAPETD